MNAFEATPTFQLRPSVLSNNPLRYVNSTIVCCPLKIDDAMVYTDNSQSKQVKQWNRPRKIRRKVSQKKNIFVGSDNEK